MAPRRRVIQADASPKRRPIILADAGALIAALDEDDQYHGRAVEVFATLGQAELLTTCAAFTEAMALLGRRVGTDGHQALWDLVERDVLRVAPDPEDWSQVARLMAKYRDTPMALADAQLMVLADDMGSPPIFTFDSDFRIYRLRNGTAPDILS